MYHEMHLTEDERALVLIRRFLRRFADIQASGYGFIDAVADVLADEGYTVLDNEHYVNLTTGGEASPDESEDPWAWAPPAGEETGFAFVPPGGVFLIQRRRPETACPYDPEYLVKVAEPGIDARYLANPDMGVEVDGDQPVLHVTEPIRTFAVQSTERWTVDVAYTIAARDEEEAQRLVEHGLVAYDRHEHPGHDDQVLTVECLGEV